MSMNYSPELVKTLMEERARELKKDELLYCCLEREADRPVRSIQERLVSLLAAGPPPPASARSNR